MIYIQGHAKTSTVRNKGMVFLYLMPVYFNWPKVSKVRERSLSCLSGKHGIHGHVLLFTGPHKTAHCVAIHFSI